MVKILACFFLSITLSYGHKLPLEVQEIVSNALELESNFERGKELYKSKCLSCHGDKGVPRNSRAASIPYLADQTPKYLLIHMAMFKTKHRINPIMNTIASNLTTQDMADLKNYLISSEVRAKHCDERSFNEANSRSIERGRLLSHKKREFQRGDGSTVAISCTMCHGENGLMPTEYRESTLHPDLAGLGKVYLKKQFLDFKSLKRVNAGPMNIMVRDLTKRNIADLSAYYSSLDRCNN
jgi:cytochrome c553